MSDEVRAKVTRVIDGVYFSHNLVNKLLSIPEARNVMVFDPDKWEYKLREEVNGN